MWELSSYGQKKAKQTEAEDENETEISLGKRMSDKTPILFFFFLSIFMYLILLYPFNLDAALSSFFFAYTQKDFWVFTTFLLLFCCCICVSRSHSIQYG